MIRAALPTLTAIAVALAAITGGVLAHFTDTGQVHDNALGASILLLSVTDPGTASGSFGGDDFVPDAVFTGEPKLKNIGTVGGDHVDIMISNQVIEAGELPGSEATTPADTVLEVTSLRYDADADGNAEIDVLTWSPPIPADVNGNGIVDLDDLEHWNVEATVEDLVDLPHADLDIEHVLEITLKVHPGLWSEEHTGDSVTLTMEFTLNQHSSQ